MSFQDLDANDINFKQSTMVQLIDVTQEDISGSVTRRKYQVFVTGGIGPGVTSSLFQTVYDQAFSLQTANPIFDLTVGLYSGSSVVTNASTGEDANGKLLFSSNSLMMREKVDVYKQFSQVLLGDQDQIFHTPPNSSESTAQIKNALFLNFKRLFSRDKLTPETFALNMYLSGAACQPNEDGLEDVGQSNLNRTSTSGSTILTDLAAASNNIKSAYAGQVGALRFASDTSIYAGLIFYDAGVVCLDLDRVTSGSQRMSGTIAAMQTAASIDGASIPAGTTVMGTPAAGNRKAKLIPDFLVSGSMDDLCNHFASTRFQSGSALSAMTFQNLTKINSTLITVRATAADFNYSSNPTFINPVNSRIRVIQTGQEANQRSFTMPTTIGLYGADNRLLAVAKLSRPIEKNDEKDITFTVRLDF